MSDRILIESRDAGNEAGSGRRPRPLTLALVFALVVVGWSVLDDAAGPSPPANEIQLPPDPFRPPTGTWSTRTFDGDGGFTSVAEGESGLVAVGTGRRVDSPPFAWFTPDGVNWTKSGSEWSGGDVITAVVASNSRFYAAGYRPTDLDALEDTAPALWESTDGRAWALVDTSGLSEQGVVMDIAVVGDTLVAIGWAGPARLEPTTPPDPDSTEGRIWTSRNGRQWSDQTPPGERLWFTDVTSADGTIVVSGSRGEVGTLWIETAEGWLESERPGDRDSADVVIAVAERPNGLVAVLRPYYDVEGLPTVWTVDDGERWTEIQREGRPTAAGWVDSIGGGFFAGPAFSRSIYPSVPELWVSVDGAEWVGVELTRGRSPWPPTVITDVTAFEEGLFAFGSRGGVPTSWVHSEG